LYSLGVDQVFHNNIFINYNLQGLLKFVNYLYSIAYIKQIELYMQSERYCD